MITTRSRRAIATVLVAGLGVILAGCAAAIDVEIPEKLTPPGSTLPVGDTALVPGTAQMGDKVIDAQIATTVVSITAQDASFFDKLDNGSTFAGYTPYTVVLQHDLPSKTTETHTQPESTEVWGVLSNGELAEYLVMDGAASTSQICGDGSGESGDSWSRSCQVFLVPKGAKFDHVEWNAQELTNISVSSPTGDSSPYLNDPIIWK